MKEIILKELFCQGFSKEPTGRFPEKIYKVQDQLIEIAIAPFKEVFVEDFLRSLRKYVNFSIVFRGDWSIDLENSHKEPGNWEVVCYYEKEVIFEGKVEYSFEKKREIFKGKIYLENIPNVKRIYVVIKEGRYSDFEETIRRMREEAVVIVDEKRSFEKVKSIAREMNLDYVMLFDDITKINGEAIVYDVKLQREKKRNVFEVVS